MKSYVLFVVFLKLLQGYGVITCKTGEVLLKNQTHLAALFQTEYTSKMNAMWNFLSMNWKFHLKGLPDYDMYNLCDCVISKLYPRREQIAIELEETTLQKSGIDVTKFINITKDIPAISCLASNVEHFLVEGYKNHGLWSTYDIYVVTKNSTTKQIDFQCLVRSVNLKSLDFNHVYLKSSVNPEFV